MADGPAWHGGAAVGAAADGGTHRSPTGATMQHGVGALRPTAMPTALRWGDDAERRGGIARDGGARALLAALANFQLNQELTYTRETQ